MIKIIIKYIIFILSLSLLIAQQTVGVLDFEGIGVSSDEARALSNRFGTEFMELSKGRYVLVERQQMGEILEEQGLQQSGCVSSECAVEVGAALGALFIVTGSISKVGNIYSVNAKLLDVETTEIVNAISHDQMGNIGILLTSGMKETAIKLLGLGSSSAPVSASTGSMRLVSSEEGITLHNAETGKFISVAPTTPEVIKDMNPGTYRFIAKKLGYKDKLFEVRVVSGRESNLTITGLVRPTGVINFNVDVVGAEVYINNFGSGEYKLLGSAPIRTSSLQYSSYGIKITKAGYDDYINSKVVVNASEKTLNISLKRTWPSVTINADPNEADLLIDNNNYPKFTIKTFRLEPGSHSISVSKDGYLPQSDNVYLDYGDNKEINFNLVRAVADIRFNVNVDSYSISENNKSIDGQINENILSNVEFGFHNYLLSAKKYESTLVDININNVGLINQNVNLVKKSRIKAFRKSLLFPGSGQLYAENKTKGFLMMTLHLGAGFIIYSNYTKYNDSSSLKDENYRAYINSTSPGDINKNHALYKTSVNDANDAAGILMGVGATFAINWAFSAIDALLFSGL